jgi:predicted GNAT family acetyltransferase
MAEELSDETQVEHQPEASRFAVEEDGRTAVAEYRLEGDGVVFYHTEVPEGLRGEGLAAALAQTALDWAREEGLRVTPECAFIRGWIERHPEYQELTS